MLPATRPALWPWTSARVGPLGPGGAAAGTPAKRRPWATSTLVRASHGQRRTIPFPSGPMRAGDHAARGPRGHVDPLRPAGAARHRATPGSSARTARRQRRGHQRPVRPDTWMYRTPDTWMLDVRSTGWTDIPTADRTRRTGQRPAWPASGHLATGDTRWAARPSPGSRRLGALGHPRRLGGDGTCAAALTAAATGQLPSTARQEAAPRRTAVVCWIWMVREEGNGTTEGEG